MKKVKITLLIFDILCIACLIVFYGPNGKFRDWLITTAINTKSHGYLARVVYNDDVIKKVMSENYIKPVEELTDENEIVFENEDTNMYDSVYDEQILKRDKNNDVYKIIEIDGYGYHAYLTVIYDASRLTTMKSKYYGTRGQFLSTMAKENDAIVAINGGGFIDINGQGDGGRAAGVFISNGEVIENAGDVTSPIIGITDKNVLILGNMTATQAVNMGIRDALCFGPFLIVNGKPAIIGGNGGYGTDPRTVIAQRKDGIILFLTVDGNGTKLGYRGGISMGEIINILTKYKAYNAANLDGGASTVLAINGKAYNHPVAYSDSGERWLPNGWMVK